MPEWLRPLITSGAFTGALVVALYLGRDLLRTYLTGGIEHRFNTRLEEMRSQLRDSEERLKADLRAKEAELATLRGGVMTAMSSRQVAVDKRRLEAVDQLWSAVISIGQTKPIATMLGVVKFDAAAKAAERDQRLRDVFESMSMGFDVKKLDLSGAVKARPFLSATVWATYSALAAISSHSVMKWQILKSGLKDGKDLLVDDKTVAQVIKAALPQYSNLIDTAGSAGYYLILEELEKKLVDDIQGMLAGVEVDKAALERAADIVKLSSELTKRDAQAASEVAPLATPATAQTATKENIPPN